MRLRKRIAGLFLLLALLGGCVVDALFSVVVDDQRYLASCVVVVEGELGQSLQDVESSHYGTLHARELNRVPRSDAVAVLAPAEYCGFAADSWVLFWNDSLPKERLAEIMGVYVTPTSKPRAGSP